MVSLRELVHSLEHYERYGLWGVIHGGTNAKGVLAIDLRLDGLRRVLQSICRLYKINMDPGYGPGCLWGLPPTDTCQHFLTFPVSIQILSHLFLQKTLQLCRTLLSPFFANFFLLLKAILYGL